MRRQDREITDLEKIVFIMKKCKVCHVAFHGGDYPYVVPMNFGFEVFDGKITLYFHGAVEGRKNNLIKKDNRVGFVMERTDEIVTGAEAGACECTMDYESVMGTGNMEFVEESQKAEALLAILKQYDIIRGEDYRFPERVMAKTSVFALKVNSISAKKK